VIDVKEAGTEVTITIVGSEGVNSVCSARRPMY
jgi:hypothetical protein